MDKYKTILDYVKATIEEVGAKWQFVNPDVDSVECSNCGYQIFSEELMSPFCPWCGKPMINYSFDLEDDSIED